MNDNDTPLVTLNGEPIPGRMEVSDGRWLVEVREKKRHASRTEVPVNPAVRYNVAELEAIEAALNEAMDDYLVS